VLIQLSNNVPKKLIRLRDGLGRNRWEEERRFLRQKRQDEQFGSMDGTESDFLLKKDGGKLLTKDGGRIIIRR